MSTTLNDFGRARLRLVQDLPTPAPKPVKRAPRQQPVATAVATTDDLPTAAQEERLRQAILALPLENCGLTVSAPIQY